MPRGGAPIRSRAGRLEAGASAAEAMAVGLLRTASGLTLEEVAATMTRSTTWVRARLGEHRRRLQDDAAYSLRAAAALAGALRQEAGRLGDPRVIPIVSPAESDSAGPFACPWPSPRGR